MEFSRQEYWSGLPFTSAGALPNPRIESGSPALQTYSLPSEPPGKPLMITHSSILAWKIPGTEKPDGYSSGARKESDMTEHNNTPLFIHSVIAKQNFYQLPV